MLLQKPTLRQARGSVPSRGTPAVVRCTATLEPATTAPPTASAPSTSSSRTPLFRSSGPRRTSSTATDTPTASSASASPRTERSQQPGEPGQQGQQGAGAAKSRYPEVSFLGDEDEQVSYRAKMLFKRGIAPRFSAGRILARSLGGNGAASLMKFAMELREAGGAAAFQVDVRLRLYNEKPVPVFGTPLMVAVERVYGRISLPEATAAVATAAAAADATEEAPVLRAAFNVSRSTDPSRLEAALQKMLPSLGPGQYARIDMVGNSTLLMGLQALFRVREGMGRSGGRLFAIPTLDVVPLREKPQGRKVARKGEQEQQTAPQHAEDSGSSNGASAAAPQESTEAPAEVQAEVQAEPAAVSGDSLPSEPQPEQQPQQAQSESEPQSVQVLRLYVGRTPLRAELAAKAAEAAAAAAAAPAPAAAALVPVAAAPVPAAAAAAASAGSSAEAVAAGPNQILVSASEWEALKGALGSMMEQQRALAALLEAQQRQQQVTAAAAAAVPAVPVAAAVPGPVVPVAATAAEQQPQQQAVAVVAAQEQEAQQPQA